MTLELVLVVVDKVLLRIEELDDDDTIDEVEDTGPELLMLEAIELALLLLEDDGWPLLADELELDVIEVVALLRLLEAEEDVEEEVELELETDELGEYDRLDGVDELDELGETEGLELADVLDNADEFVETEELGV